MRKNLTTFVFETENSRRLKEGSASEEIFCFTLYQRGGDSHIGCTEQDINSFVMEEHLFYREPNEYLGALFPVAQIEEESNKRGEEFYNIERVLGQFFRNYFKEHAILKHYNAKVIISRLGVKIPYYKRVLMSSDIINLIKLE